MQTMLVKGVPENMAYETKVILVAIAEMFCKAESLEEAYAALKKIANAEGVVLQPYEEVRAEVEELRKKQK